MKVLWVCNIMLPVIAEALHKEASNKEGWLSGLLEQVGRYRRIDAAGVTWSWLWHSRCRQIRRCPGDCR